MTSKDLEEYEREYLERVKNTDPGGFEPPTWWSEATRSIHAEL